MSIYIEKFEDLQKVQEEYDIPFAANITQVITELINHFASKDIPEVKIYLNDLVIPDSYKYNTCVWAKHIKPNTQYPFVKSFRVLNKNQICIYAGGEDYEPNFFKRLKLRLAENDVISFDFENVPKAYQANPWTLVNRLKKLSIQTSVAVHHNKLIIRRK